MLKRKLMTLLFGALLAVLASSMLTAACSGPARLGLSAPAPTPATTGAGGDVLVRRPVQQLALSLMDLPPGFTIAEELKPALDAAADPFGRLSAYGVTYAPAAGAAGSDETWREVVSSVITYVGMAQAAEAFASWRSVVPLPYRLAEGVGPKLGDETVVYVRGSESGTRGVRPTCLVGLRTRNVIASISVAARSGTDVPVEAAVRLARLTAQRIQAAAGR
jgi:hypothetical protein